MDHTKLYTYRNWNGGPDALSAATNRTSEALKNANYATNTIQLDKSLNETIADDYTVKINTKIIQDIVSQASKFPDRYNILERATDDELIAEVKKRKIPYSKFVSQPEYNWKHHRLMTNNIRYLI